MAAEGNAEVGNVGSPDGLRALQMRSDSEAAPESAASFTRASHASSVRRWRLPIAYRAISSVALCSDLALISASAFSVEALYHNIPSEFEGEFSHTMAAAMFVAVLFIAAMRVQKLYDPTRLIVMDDQARSVLSAWCGAFLILASGVFTWGVSRDSPVEKRTEVMMSPPSSSPVRLSVVVSWTGSRSPRSPPVFPGNGQQRLIAWRHSDFLGVRGYRSPNAPGVLADRAPSRA